MPTSRLHRKKEWNEVYLSAAGVPRVFPAAQDVEKSSFVLLIDNHQPSVSLILTRLMTTIIVTENSTETGTDERMSSQT